MRPNRIQEFEIPVSLVASESLMNLASKIAELPVFQCVDDSVLGNLDSVLFDLIEIDDVDCATGGTGMTFRVSVNESDCEIAGAILAFH